MNLILAKVLLGMSLAAPIGPVSIEVIKRGLSRGFRAAFMIGLGSAVGDSIYLLITYFGLYPLLANPLSSSIICGVGASVLLYLGIQAIRDSKNPLWIENSQDLSGKNGFLLGASLALINPFTAVWWLSVFGGMLSSAPEEMFTPTAFLINSSVLLGVILWFFIASTILSYSKQFVTKNKLKVVSLLSGICMIYFGGKYGLQAYDLFQTWMQL